MKRGSLNQILSTPFCITLVAALISIQGCTREQRMRMDLDPLTIDQFYTTSYSGEVKQEYEKKIVENSTSGPVTLRNAPPRVTRFRQGERVCLAVHSFEGEPYEIVYKSPYGPEGDFSDRHVLLAWGIPEVVGTGFKFDTLFVGGKTASWEAVGVEERSYAVKPDQWVWLDSLTPGLYKVRFKPKDTAGRTYNLETSFTVE